MIHDASSQLQKNTNSGENQPRSINTSPSIHPRTTSIDFNMDTTPSTSNTDQGERSVPDEFPGYLQRAESSNHQERHTLPPLSYQRQNLQYPPPQIPTRLDHRELQQYQMTFDDIQEELKKVLDFVDQGKILYAFENLSSVTSIIVMNCDRFGLTSDEKAPYNEIDREGFWQNLNNCWLYALANASGSPTKTQQQQIEQQQQCLGQEHLYRVRDSIVSWADLLERYGLVDYEMGFWERDLLEAVNVQINLTLQKNRNRNLIRLDPSLQQYRQTPASPSPNLNASSSLTDRKLHGAGFGHA
ncbi:hypothetical protein G9A89_006696 [Geosiphon pyriformis]|nr:hypothetical protein G9A89_006696 [Geosiphon pyriformis]